MQEALLSLFAAIGCPRSDEPRTAMARERCSDQEPQWFNDGHIMPQMAVWGGSSSMAFSQLVMNPAGSLQGPMVTPGEVHGSGLRRSLPMWMRRFSRATSGFLLILFAGAFSPKLENLNYGLGTGSAPFEAKRIEGIHRSPYAHPADDGGKALCRYGTEQPAAGAMPPSATVGQRRRESLVDPGCVGASLPPRLVSRSRSVSQVAIVGGPGRQTHRFSGGIQVTSWYGHGNVVLERRKKDRVSELQFDNGDGVVGQVLHRPPSPRVSWAIEPVMELDGTRAPHRKLRGSKICMQAKK
jgi:hypothetical protein